MAEEEQAPQPAAPKAWAIVRDGFTINTVVWDGVSDWTPPEGCTVVPIEEAPPHEDATPRVLEDASAGD